MKPAPALLVEDDPFTRRAVADFLQEEMDLQVHQAASYEQARAILDWLAPSCQLALVDVSLPRAQLDEAERRPWGLDLIQEIKTINARCGVVLWSAYTHFLPKVMELVAQGYRGLACIPKGVRAQMLREAVQRVLAGDVFLHRAVVRDERQNLEALLLANLDPDVAQLVADVAQRLEELTPRQKEVVSRITRTPTAIAQELGLEVRTVRNYQDAIYERLGLREPIPAIQHIRRDPIITLALILNHLKQADTS